MPLRPRAGTPVTAGVLRVFSLPLAADPLRFPFRSVASERPIRWPLSLADSLGLGRGTMFRARSPMFFGWVENASNFAKFASGFGSNFNEYSYGGAYVDQLKNAPGVNNARRAFCRER